MRLKSLFLYLLLACIPLRGLDYNQPVMAEAEGVTLWTESLGEWSDQKAILLIAGCGSNGRFWPDYFCEQLVDAGYFVIRYDHRDVGLSSPAPKQFDVVDLADDAVAVLDAYHIEKADIVGMSMGGMVSQFFAANYPDRVKTMSLIATSPVGGTRLLDRPMTFAETLTMTNTVHFLLNHFLTGDYHESLPIFLKRFAYFNGKYELDEAMTKNYAWNCYFRTIHPPSDHDGSHVIAVQRMMKTLDQRRAIYKQIDAPTLVIHGLEDHLILASRGGIAIHDAIQGARLSLYPDMGHAIFNRGLLDCLIVDILGLIHDHESI